MWAGGVEPDGRGTEGEEMGGAPKKVAGGPHSENLVKGRFGGEKEGGFWAGERGEKKNFFWFFLFKNLLIFYFLNYFCLKNFHKNLGAPAPKGEFKKNSPGLIFSCRILGFPIFF